MKTTTKGVTAKLFLGLLLTPDIQIKLKQSRPWQEGSIEDSQATRKLHIAHYQNKEYLGVHIDQTITLNELKMTLLFCLDQYKHYLPDIQVDNLKPTIFSQIFIS